MYRVIKFFTDLQDNDHPYDVGDTFPRKGMKVTKGRLAELAGPSNRQGVPLIELVEETPDQEEAEKAVPEETAPEPDEEAAAPEEKPKRTRKKAAE